MLILYGTDSCHLCHDAQSLLGHMGLSWQDIDIIDDDVLLERYGAHIPVLKSPYRELNWPFNQEDVIHLLALTIK